MKRYLIICEETCPDCKGQRVISNPIYQEWSEWRREWEKEHPLHGVQGIHQEASFRADDEWFAQHGYPGGCKYWPQEEYRCDTCNGTGVYRHEIELESVAKEMEGLHSFKRSVDEALNMGDGSYKP